MNILEPSPDTLRKEMKCKTCQTILAITPEDCFAIGDYGYAYQTNYECGYRCPVCGDSSEMAVNRLFYKKVLYAIEAKKIKAKEEWIDKWPSWLRWFAKFIANCIFNK